VLTVMMMLKHGSNSRMTMFDLPMNWVYGVCMLGFAAMALPLGAGRAGTPPRGYSVLERPNRRWKTASAGRKKRRTHAQIISCCS
jgi:hypothetical protein